MQVITPIGIRFPDNSGSPLGVVRMDPSKAYGRIPLLLQNFINNHDNAAWSKISERIDYIYRNAGIALKALDSETHFTGAIRKRVSAGQRLLFKPNLVNAQFINSINHGPGVVSACTPWSYVAALMRWFHDEMEISYHMMSLGEASTTMSAVSDQFAVQVKRPVPTIAVMEGRSGDFYGGWGFYFTRIYLQEKHPVGHTDNPMNGYEESLKGVCLAPGKAADKLMVYDLNKIADDGSDGRVVPVPHGDYFKHITLHKAIIGGDPNDDRDHRDWPGCVLINVPKLKMHVLEIFTNAVKNLGIGLYPMEVSAGKEDGGVRWKYAQPQKHSPNMKDVIPHRKWHYRLFDDKTALPLKDSQGNYLVTKTNGIKATMADVLAAVKKQNIYMLHIVDSIEATNHSQSDPAAPSIPEGMIFCGLDPLAVDKLCANYVFHTVPMAEAYTTQQQQHLPSHFLQKIPLPMIHGTDIVTGQGFDSPLPRYVAFPYWEKRGIGQEKYYVTGLDTVSGMPLVSIEGHLGYLQAEKFTEIRTDNLYYAINKPVYDLQAMVFAYLEANDTLTGSTYKRDLLHALDENGDGIIDYDERGKGVYHALVDHAIRIPGAGLDFENTMRIRFLIQAWLLKYVSKNWNPYGFQVGPGVEVGWNPGGSKPGVGLDVNLAIMIAWQLSRLPEEKRDPYFPRMTYGKGKWPSLQFAQYLDILRRTYGAQYPERFDFFTAPYGLAFLYTAIKKDNRFLAELNSNPVADIIGNYHRSLTRGGERLPFTFYVPPVYGQNGIDPIPNVEETSDPALVFTASFNNGKTVWRDLTLEELP